MATRPLLFRFFPVLWFDPIHVRGRFANIALGLAIVTWTLLGHVAISEADVVFLKNGDRVSGDLIALDDTVLTIDTDYADIVKIDCDDVAGLPSDSPLWLAFHDGAIILDGLGTRHGDRLILFRPDLDGPIQLNQVRAIHFFELSYRGTIGLGKNVFSQHQTNQ